MLHQLLATLAMLIALSHAHGEAAVAQVPPSPARGLSPAFHHAVVGSEDKMAAGRSDLQASPQDAPRKGVVTASPPVELRKLNLPTKNAIKEDSRMKFFSVPVGTKTPQEMKLPALRTDEKMQFFSIPVGSHRRTPSSMTLSGAEDCQ